MSRFTDAITRNLEGVEAFSVGACPGCEVCFPWTVDPHNPTEDEYDAANTSDFSWHSCESCGSTLAGDRHPAHGLIDGELHHFSVCADCLFWHANGDEPIDGEWAEEEEDGDDEDWSDGDDDWNDE